MYNLRNTISQDALLNFQSKLISQIVITYFLEVYTICRIVNQTKSTNKPFLNIQSDLPIAVVYPQETADLLHSPMVQAIELGCTHFLVDEDALPYFLDHYISIHDETLFRRPEKYVLIAVQSIGTAQASLMKAVQLHPSLQDIANLLLVVPNAAKFELITHRYVGNAPNSLDWIHLDTYDPETGLFMADANLFPDKLSNLMGKTLKVATFYLLPWSMMRQTDDGIVRYLDQQYTIDGLDGYILIQFCLWYNCTWELYCDQANQYGQVFPNRTGNGMIGALIERKVDFAIGAVGGWYQLFQYFSFSNPVQWIGITCLAPRPGLIEYWRIVFMMFAESVWGILILTFIMVSMLQYLLPPPDLPESHSQRSFSWIVINLLCAFLLLPSNLRRDPLSDVILSSTLSVFTLTVAYVYIGKIHSILAFPVYEPPIDTILDLAVSGIPWNAPHEAWMYALVGTENPNVQKVLTTFRVPPIEDIPIIADEGKEAIIMALLNYGHSMVGTWFDAKNIENYRLMTELLYFEYDTGYATKTWPLLDRFDRLAMWIRDACLFQYVELVDVYRYMNYWVQTSIAHSKDRPQNLLRIMNVEEISGGLMILGIGLVLAIAVFALELGIVGFRKTSVYRVICLKWKSIKHSCWNVNNLMRNSLDSVN
ncbi:uncharacterized protein LOC5563600 isoform X2 [Aedes aegypti]|uniref:Ionotropic glutamate receptor L-glutamate and glycine-binding domain-containing protein n=1 Tax=Aedes aegypti TaxID=7159 RepID=A0A6I8T2W4_AEDAE|nr:uncharacterized protein LOC5563600 isoform X2 [Aedes aegypti]